MNDKERRVYKLEKQIIRRHFSGLRARPIKLTRDESFYGRANEPFMEIDEGLLKPSRKQDLEDCIKHELIHYELKDSKAKHYHGHGKAFFKRARELGIVDAYVLTRCHSLEEDEHVPHRIQINNDSVRRIQKRSGSGFRAI